MNIQKNEKIRFVASICLMFVAVLIFCLSTMKNDFLYVPHFHSKFKKVCFNIELPKELKNRVTLLVNDVDLSKSSDIYWEEFRFEYPTDNCNSLGTSYFFPVESLKIKIDGNRGEAEKILKQISSSIVFVGDEFFSFDNSQISDFKRISDDKSTTVTLPDLAKNQYKGDVNAFVVNFFSLIFGWQNYIIGWVLMFLGIFVLPRSRIKISGFCILGSIFLFGTIFRLNMCGQYPFWFDELVLTYGCGGDHLDSLYKLKNEMCNPPVTIFIYRMITCFSYDVDFFRTIFALIGYLGLFTVYLLGKDRVSEKVGLISALIAASSMYAISYSQNCRSYAFSFVIAPLFAFFMFKTFENKSFKYYLGLCLSGIIVINLHLFGSIFLFVNFIYGVWHNLKEKDYKNVVKFTGVYVLIGFSFLPFFMNTILKGHYLDSGFTYMPNCTYSEILITNFGTIPLAVFLVGLAIMAVIFRKFAFPDYDKKQNEFLSYLIYFMFCFYIVTILISKWRGILNAHYFYIIYGFEIIFISSFIARWHRVFAYIFLLYFLSTQKFNTSFYSVMTYRDLDKVISWVADKHKMVYPFNVNFSEFFPYKPNTLWISEEIYYSDGSYDVADNNLQDFINKFNTSKDSVFLINTYFIHKPDVEIFFNHKYNEKYDLSLICAPYNYILKIQPK